MPDLRTFSLFIHSKRSATPNLAFEIAGDEATVRVMAVRALQESPDHFRVEVREADRLLFTLERDGTVHRILHNSSFTNVVRGRFPASSEALSLR